MTPRLDLIGLVVADMDRSLAFYRRLGLAVPEGAEGQPHVEVDLPGGVRLAWDTVESVRSYDPSWSPASGSARTHLAFVCDSPAEVDSVYADMHAYGHLPPWDAPWGQRYAILHDPDSNAVDLFAANPSSPGA